MGRFLIFLILTAVTLSFSVPANPFPSEIVQPDGTRIVVFLKGDEYFHWTETEEGYPVVKDEMSGWWYYATFTKGKLVKTDFIAGKVDPSSVGIKEVDRGWVKAFVSASKPNIQYAPPPLPHNQNILVILVDFDDMNGTSAGSDFNGKFFGAGKTVKDFYSKMSNGQFTIVPASESSGTANDGIVGWIRIGTSHPNCEQYATVSDQMNCYHNSIVKPAINGADSFVNFASFDTNNNGKIEPSELSIVIVVAGYEASMQDCSNNYPNYLTWGHMSRVVNNPPVVDGVTVEYYSAFGETHCKGSSTRIASIGIMVHELGHLMFNLPDLYDTDGSSKGIGVLGVMGSGSWGRISSTEWPGDTPISMCAWTRAYVGFITPTQYSNNANQQGINVYEYNGSNANIIRVNTNLANEYFLITYRATTAGTYDEALKVFGINNGGVAIWHIDESLWPACNTDNSCNKNENRKMVDFEEADGNQDLDQGQHIIRDADFFSDSGTNAFNVNTNPDSKLNDGSDSGVSISVVGFSPGYYVIDLVAGSGGVPAISLSPASVDFGEVNVGSSSSAEITISNTGTANLSVTSVSLSGTDSGEFSTDLNGGSNPCGSIPFVIRIGSSCTITVIVSPTKEGQLSAILTVQSNDPTNGTVNISLSATGKVQSTGGTGGGTSGGSTSGGGTSGSGEKKGDCTTTNTAIPLLLIGFLILLRSRKGIFTLIILLSFSAGYSKHITLECFANDGATNAGPNTKTVTTINGSTTCSAVPISKDNIYADAYGNSSLKFRRLKPKVAGDMCQTGVFSQRPSYVKAEATGTVLLLGLPPYKITVDEKLWLKIYGRLEIFTTDPNNKARIEGCVNGTDKIVEFTQIQQFASITPSVISGSAELTQGGLTTAKDLSQGWTDTNNFLCNGDQSLSGVYTGKEINKKIEIQLKDVYPRKIARVDMCVKISGFARDLASRADFKDNNYIVGLFVYDPDQNNQQQGQNPPPRGKNKPFIGVAPLDKPYLIILPGVNMPQDTKFSTNMTGHPVLQINAFAVNNDINISKISVTISNNFDSIKNGSLYLDEDGDGKVSSKDTLLSTANPDQTGKLVFTINVTVSRNQAKNFLLLIDTSSKQTDKDIQFSILANSDVELTTQDAITIGAPVYGAVLYVSQGEPSKDGGSSKSGGSSKKGCASLGYYSFLFILLPLTVAVYLRRRR